MRDAGIKYNFRHGPQFRPGREAIVGKNPGPNITGLSPPRKPSAASDTPPSSLGSSDNVAKGMKFYVVNRGTGEFLGTLIVDNVQTERSHRPARRPKPAWSEGPPK